VLQSAPNAKPTPKLPKIKTPAEQWIVGRLHQTLADVTRDLETFQFSHAVESLHRFTWDELADWYLEVAKLQPNSKLLAYLLTQTLIAWHPLCPFVTEAIWENFAQPKKKTDMLMVQRWPVIENRKQKTENQASAFEAVIDLVTQIRGQRASANVGADKTIAAAVSANKPTVRLLAEYTPFIERAARCKLRTDSSGTAKLQVSYQLPVDEARVSRECEQLRKYIASLQAKLDDQYFVAKAAPAVVEEQRRKLAEAQEKIAALG
jgi:valyl-tRNA synthetase